MSQRIYIQDEDGDLVNLRLVELIRLQPESETQSTVVAQMPGESGAAYFLKRGTAEECKAYICWLRRVLGIDL